MNETIVVCHGSMLIGNYVTPHGIKELRYLLVRVFGNGYNLLCLIS